jgi:uncharacterized protein YoxC
MVQSLVVASSTPGDILRYAAAFFLVVVAIGLVFAHVRLARTLKRVDKLVEDTDREMVPLLSRSQVTLDQVNSELSKVDEILGSIVNVTSKFDATTNVVQSAVSTPAKKAAAFSAGVTQAVSSFFARHNDEGVAETTADEAATESSSWSSTWSQGAAATGSPAATGTGTWSAVADDVAPSAAAEATGAPAFTAATESPADEGMGASPATPAAGVSDAVAPEATTEETSAP